MFLSDLMSHCNSNLQLSALFSNDSSLAAFYLDDFPVLYSSTQILCQRCIIHYAAESETSIIRLLGLFLMGAVVFLKTLGLGNLAG